MMSRFALASLTIVTINYFNSKPSHLKTYFGVYSILFELQVNLAVNLNKPIIPLLMEKTEWPPKGSMGPIFSEYLFIRFFQRGGEETNAKDKRYWPVPKFQELLMQLNYFVVPDQKMIQKGEMFSYTVQTPSVSIDII